MPLTDVKIRALKPKSADFKVADGEGLHLLVTSTGAKRWRLAYRFAGKQKTLAIGVYPAVSLLAARKAKDDARRQLADGIDPSEDKKARKLKKKIAPGITFGSISDEWFSLKEKSWAPSYASRLRSRLDNDLVVKFGERRISDIQPLELLSALRAIEDRDAIEMAKRIKQMASQIFSYAIATGRCSADPTVSLKGVLKPSNPTKHRTALPATELPRFIRELNGYDGEALTKLALKLVILTLVRTAEARFGKWPEMEGLDGREPLWRIPSERMKMRRQHLVPLSPQAVTVIKELRKLTGEGEYILPSPTKSGVISENTMIYALYRMGYHSKATVHGFRSTASTALNEQQFNRDWIEMQLAHFDGSVRGVYNAAEWLPGRRKMMRWWGAFVETGEGEPTDPAAEALAGAEEVGAG